jgi:hypothetical protein
LTIQTNLLGGFVMCVTNSAGVDTRRESAENGNAARCANIGTALNGLTDWPGASARTTERIHVLAESSFPVKAELCP